MQPKKAGFSLTELLIVIAIVGILATIAIPNYQPYIYKTGRQKAIAKLLEIQLMQERYRSNNANYANKVTLNASEQGPIPTSDNYQFDITHISDTTYTITATAKPGSKQVKDTACQTLTINQDSDKTPSDCW